MKRSKSKSNTSKSPSSAKPVDRKKKKHRKSAKRQLGAPGLNTDNNGDLQQMTNDAVKRNVEHLMKLASAQDVNETAQHDTDGKSHLVIPSPVTF